MLLFMVAEEILIWEPSVTRLAPIFFATSMHRRPLIVEALVSGKEWSTRSIEWSPVGTVRGAVTIPLDIVWHGRWWKPVHNYCDLLVFQLESEHV